LSSLPSAAGFFRAWTRVEPGRVRRSGAAILAVLLLVALAAPSAAHAEEGKVRLALTPVGQAGSFFDLTMAPGESRSLEIDIGNAGATELAARTYAADVYTIINGGFGAHLRDDPQTDTTRWLSYPTQVLRLAAGAGVRRTFAVVVPTHAAPGEYITSLVLENDQPIRGSGAVGLDQVVRQAVAVVVTVPGPRLPGLAIGLASHKVVAGRSVVSIGVENTGNVRLKPLVTFALVDTTGAEISHSTMRMDTFYAHTRTSVEMQLAELLPPGTYTVRLTLEGAEGMPAESDAITLVVEAPTALAPAVGDVGGLIDVVRNSGAGPSSLPTWGIGIGAGLLALFTAWLIRRRHRRRTRGVVGSDS
jgi:hypothetical protein